MFGTQKKLSMPSTAEALPGRDDALVVPSTHYVSGRDIHTDYPENAKELIVGLGCFWGAERRFWQTPGVWVTSVGYAAGFTPNPSYEEVCSGQTGHNEVVRVIYDADEVSLEQLLRVFWEAHNPTQGMQQGNDRGTQYRSGIYLKDPEELALAEQSKRDYQQQLTAAGFGQITTEILPQPAFYFAEDYHQQYLAKNPGGYCGLGGTGVSCPVGVGSV